MKNIFTRQFELIKISLIKNEVEKFGTYFKNVNEKTTETIYFIFPFNVSTI